MERLDTNRYSSIRRSNKDNITDATVEEKPKQTRHNWTYVTIIGWLFGTNGGSTNGISCVTTTQEQKSEQGVILPQIKDS